MTGIRIYTEATGRAPFAEWLNTLKDVQGRARIRARLARVQAGSLGVCKPLREGVQELRIDHGPPEFDSSRRFPPRGLNEINDLAVMF